MPCYWWVLLTYQSAALGGGGAAVSPFKGKVNGREFTPKGYWIGKTFIGVSHYLLVTNTLSSPRKS